MKRKLSLLMAFMMAATLVPATPSIVDAASDNSIAAVKSTTSDGKIYSELKIIGTNGNDGKAGISAGNKFYLNYGEDAEILDGAKKLPDGSYDDKNVDLTAGVSPEALGGVTYYKVNGKFLTADQVKADEIENFDAKIEDKEIESILATALDEANKKLEGVVNEKVAKEDLTFTLNQKAIDQAALTDIVTQAIITTNDVTSPIKITKTSKNKLTVTAGGAVNFGYKIDMTKAETALNGLNVKISDSKAFTAVDGKDEAAVTAAKTEAAKAAKDKAIKDFEVKVREAAEAALNKAGAAGGIQANEFGFDATFKVEFNGASGTQKVTIEGSDSTVTSGDLTYATIGDDKIQVTLDKKEKISRSGNQKINLTFKEIVANAFAEITDHKIELRLPVDFAWSLNGEKTSVTGATFSIDEHDSRILKVVVDPKKFSTDTLDRIELEAKIVPNRDAKYGDVDVTIDGSDTTPSSLVVAEYVPYGVTAKAEKVLNVIAGKHLPGKYVAKLTVEEPAVGGFIDGRYMEFKFVDEKGEDVDASLQDNEVLKIKEPSIVDPKIDISSIEGHHDKKGLERTVRNYTWKWDGTKVKRAMANQFDVKITVPDDQKDRTKTAKYKLEVPFVVASDFTGKLFLKVKGAGADEQLVQIADVKAPITAEVQGALPQVKLGVQKQAGNNILVKETEAGALQDYMPVISDYDKNSKDEISETGFTKATNNIEYYLRMDEDFGAIFKAGNVKVTEGDLSIKEKEDDGVDDGHQLYVTVNRRSTKPSTLEFSNIEITLDRTVPYGAIKLKEVFGAVHSAHDLTDKVAKLDYITNVTPIDDSKRVATVFKLDDPKFVEITGKGQKNLEMDTAPFAQDNRIMLPMRFVAQALGANVNYDNGTRIATFQKDAVTVSINIDSDVMYVNGTPIKLATKLAKKDGRIFLPLVNVAQAFGLEHGKTLIWNQNDKTVTILPQDATAAEIESAKSGDIKLDGQETKKEEVKAEDKKDEKKEEVKEEKKEDKKDAKAEETKEAKAENK